MLAILAAILAFTAGFLGLCYFIARAIADAITAHRDARDEKRLRDAYWEARVRSAWRAW